MLKDIKFFLKQIKIFVLQYIQHYINKYRIYLLKLHDNTKYTCCEY